MDGEYRALNDASLETRVLFFGKEHCMPNYFFTGNNVRKNYVIHCITSGKGTFSSANHSQVELSAGDIFILPKDVPCFYKADSHNPWSYFWIGLSGIKISTMLSGSILASRHYIRNVTSSHFYESLVKLYQVVHNSHSLANDLLIESLIYQTFYHLDTEYPARKRPKSTEKNVQLQSAITYLRDNFAQHTCSINSLCHHLDVSRSYLYTIFKNELNLSPQQCLIQIRMENAKNKIKESALSIKQIAHSVGYSDEFTFSKAFKRYSGFSPQVYRQLKTK